MNAIAGREAEGTAFPAPSGGFEGFALRRWFRAQAASGRRIVYLEDALITGRFPRYAAYRLRFFAVRVLAATLLHGMKFALLYSFFAPEAFRKLLWLHAFAGLLASFWWGGLEVMRERVRAAARAGRPKRIPAEIHLWTTAAMLLAAAIVLGAAGALGFRAAGASGAADAYAMTIAIGLALELVTLTFHSGIYAIRRIYRPLATILGVEVVGVCSVMVLLPWIGVWSLPAAMLASSLTSAFFVLRYTSRLYRFFGFPPFGRPSLARARSIGRAGAWEFVAGGSAYALLKLDAVLVLGLFRPVHGGGDVALFALFYAVSPAIQAGFDWAHLFYFDLKRLEGEAFANLKRAYERFVARLSAGIGIALWVLACIAGTVLLRRGLGIVYVLLLPFFVSRSALASAQIRSFAAARYGALVTSGAWLLGGMLLLRATVADEPLRLALLTPLVLAVLLSLRRTETASEPTIADGDVMPFLRWLRTTAQRRRPMRLRAMKIAGEPHHPNEGVEAPERLFADRLARRLRGDGEVSITPDRRIVWWEAASSRRAPSDEWLLRLASGLAESLGATEVLPSGREALERGRQLGLVPSEAALEGDPSEDASLVAEFRELFPTGIVHDVERPSSGFAALEGRDRRGVYVEAVRFARDLATRSTRLPFEVTAYCPGDDLRLVFLVDRRTPRGRRKQWTARVRRANLAAACAAIP